MMQLQILDLANLPKSKTMTFDGDPMNFRTFMPVVDNWIGNNTVDDASKLKRPGNC